LFIISAEDLPW